MPSTLRPHILWLLLTLAVIALGLLSRQVLSGLPAKYLGVALYAVMMVCIVKLVRPSLAASFACAAALAICLAIEALQATPLPARLNAQLPPLRLILGEVFSWWDIAAYAAGVLIAYLCMRSAP